MIQTNQYSTDKPNLDKLIGDVENKIPDISGLATTAVLNTKIGEVENESPDVSGLVSTAVLKTTIGEVEEKLLMLIN